MPANSCTRGGVGMCLTRTIAMAALTSLNMVSSACHGSIVSPMSVVTAPQVVAAEPRPVANRAILAGAISFRPELAPEAALPSEPTFAYTSLGTPLLTVQAARPGHTVPARTSALDVSSGYFSSSFDKASPIASAVRMFSEHNIDVRIKQIETTGEIIRSQFWFIFGSIALLALLFLTAMDGILAHADSKMLGVQSAYRLKELMAFKRMPKPRRRRKTGM